MVSDIMALQILNLKKKKYQCQTVRVRRREIVCADNEKHALDARTRMLSFQNPNPNRLTRQPCKLLSYLADVFQAWADTCI